MWAWLLSILICKLAYDFVGYNGLFIMAGAATVGGGFAILFASRRRPPDERSFVFKRRYGLYYALNFLQGMRKQMFITFAIFALVKIHGVARAYDDDSGADESDVDYADCARRWVSWWISTASGRCCRSVISG